MLLTAAQTGGRFALVEVAETWGAGPPRHIHHWEDETIYVLEGSIDVCLGDETSIAEAGAAVLMPRLVEHSYVATSDRARLLIIAAPAGLEGFYGDPQTRGLTDRDIERLVTTAARYGVEITGPSPAATRRQAL